MQPPISFAVLSSDQLFAEAVAVLLALQPDLRPVASPEDEGWGGPGNPADILLVDASADPGQALGRLRRLRDRLLGRTKPIVVGLAQEDEGWLLDFIEAGARGYVFQSATPANLVEVIRSVHLGETPCSSRIVGSVLERISLLARQRQVPDGPEPGPLTEREREILTLMGKGLRNKEIGGRLLITTQTVKNHVHNILEKLHVSRRADAVAHVRRLPQI
jgi:DNA-binding NarL/FixJ family response regulator